MHCEVLVPENIYSYVLLVKSKRSQKEVYVLHALKNYVFWDRS